MNRRTLAAALLLAPLLSSGVAACAAGTEDSADRKALEREALERELDQALAQKDTPAARAAVTLADVPVAETTAVHSPLPSRPAPAPARPARTEPRPASRREEPRPEEPAPLPRPREETRRVPAGTTFAVRFEEEVSAREAAGGLPVTATLAEPLLAADGTTVIPAGAVVSGRTTQMPGSGRGGGEGTLAVVFTSVSYGGSSYPLDATVVQAPPVRRVNRDSGGEQAAKIGGGAAVGAILGRVLGKDTRSTVAGAAIGAAAGTVVAARTATTDQVVAAGSTARVRLDGPVVVSASPSY
jgi:hypothetical protein